ncbi:MAG: helix-turn-helix transcriptional regulator [Rubritepida sp.]|jgi:DNA-binding CsgD family transcriptional regulator|nr:helix-turn-helix transcriptional regulator [Rubritepida sp.]
MSEARLLALTEALYDAAAGAAPWDAVGHALARLLDGRTVSLMLRDPGGGSELLAHTRIPHEAVVAYATTYQAHDIWTARAAEAVRRDPTLHGRVWSSGSRRLLTDAEFLRSEFWNGFGRRYGLRHVVGSVAPLGAAGEVAVGVHRPAGAAEFLEAERRLLEAALPHLRRALQLRHRLAAAPAPAAPDGLAALDALATGVVVVDAAMGVRLANAAAEAFAAAGHGFRLRRAPGGGGVGFEALDRAEAAALTRLVGGAAMAGAAGGAMRLSGGDGAPRLAALVTPLPARLASAPLTLAGRVPGQALILLRELAASVAPRAALLRDLFGLTPTEAEVARGLMGGTTKAEVAALRGLSETTVRSHVRALLGKTGAANLRDLERMLAGLAGM